MQTFTANDAKQRFGELIDAALQAPISITKHNRPSVVVMSDAEYRALAESKHSALKAAVQAGFDQLDQGQSSKATPRQIADRVRRRFEDSEL